MAAPSVIKGIPLSEEPGLGALTLPGFLREVTSRYAEREALVLRTPEGVTRWSYAMLWERAVQVARALLACGAGKDTRTGILMTNRPEWVAAFFGVELAGGVAVALSTFSTVPELDYLLQTTAVSTLLFERSVAAKDFAAMLTELEPGVRSSAPGRLHSVKYPFLRRLAQLGEGAAAGAIETWPAFLAHAAEIPGALVEATAGAVKPSDGAALFLSSGSTSRPKAILHAHRGVAIQCWRTPRIFAFREDLRTWTPNAFTWSGNFMMALGGTLAAGGTIILQRIFEPEAALELMQAERVTFPQAWPHQWAQLEAAANWKSADLSSFHYVDRSRPAARHPTFRDTSWNDPMSSYGNTETFTLSAAFPSDTPREVWEGSHGEALPGNTLEIVDPQTGAVVPRGERGEIAVKGPTLMLGYLGSPLSETLDEGGFFHTGDAGYIDERGRLHYEGRLSDVIKTGGANVSPVEVDAVLSACPGVKIGQTVGVPHETLGELVVSCVVAHHGSSLSEGDVREYLKQRLASYKVPRRVLFVREGELSMTGSAKIKAAALRELVVKRLKAEASPT
ncbi:MAG TPA: class I adenylate-forming enzyme family protein [Steroidobacteraceae bacterium]|nr:class I adenylate-forming enzyme family protein [Steroidobacteraceae bacterium]